MAPTCSRFVCSARLGFPSLLFPFLDPVAAESAKAPRAKRSPCSCAGSRVEHGSFFALRRWIDVLYAKVESDWSSSRQGEQVSLLFRSKRAPRASQAQHAVCWWEQWLSTLAGGRCLGRRVRLAHRFPCSPAMPVDARMGPMHLEISAYACARLQRKSVGVSVEVAG